MREPPGEKRLEQGPALRVGLGTNFGASEGEKIEHGVRGRQLDGQPLRSRAAWVQASLQGGEVDPAFGPAHQFTVEDDLNIELLEAGDDLREVPGQLAWLARLQRDTVLAAIGGATVN